MGGKSNGLTDAQWRVIGPLLPREPEKRGRGYPHAPWRPICNTILWILITGSRWCDIPKGERWGARTSAHRWLGRWQESGLLDKMLASLLETVELAGLIDWERLAADGFFFEGERRGRRNNIWF